MKPEPSSAVRTDELTPLVPNDRRRRWEWKVSYVAGLSLVAILVIAVVRDGRSLTLRRFQNPTEFEKSSPNLGNSQLDNGQSCTRDGDCNSNTCGYPEAGASSQICCSQKSIFAGNDYCTPIPNGKKCWLDDHCASDNCEGNMYGIQKGVCRNKSSPKLGNSQLNNGQSCTRDGDCKSGACGYPEAGASSQICCSQKSIFAGIDYCTPIPNGKKCWSDNHCASDNCEGNMYGTQKGVCRNKPSPNLGDSHSSNNIGDVIVPAAGDAATSVLTHDVKKLRDHKMLSTHNAGTGYFAGKKDLKEGSIVNQMTDLVTQLNCGTRAFDMRIGRYNSVIPNPTPTGVHDLFSRNDDLVQFHHSPGHEKVFFVHTKSVGGAMEDVVGWAKEHPDEFILVMLKMCVKCGDCNPVTLTGCEGCSDVSCTSEFGSIFTDLGIKVIHDGSFKDTPYEQLKNEAQLPGGKGHILVVNQNGGILENWEVPGHPTSDACKEQAHSSECKKDKTYQGEESFKKLWNYIYNSLAYYGGPSGKEYPKPFWIQAHWQARSEDIDHAYYAVGLRDDMVEATVESKINYRVLEYLKRPGKVNGVNILSVNAVCKAGPEIAGVLGTHVSDADRDKCTQSCEHMEMFNRPMGEKCTMDKHCQSDACGYPEAGASSQICCSEKSIYAGNDYCIPISDGKKCWSDAQCASGYCKGNEGGLQKGTCFKKLDDGHGCTMDNDCNSNACGYPEAGASSQVCCSRKSIYGGNDYCVPISDGKKCWSDAQCASGYCKGNGGGLQKGTCFRKKSVGHGCTMDNDCNSNACGYPEAGASSQVCCSRKSIYAGNDYCVPIPNGKKCWSDAQCASDYCKGNWYGTQKGVCRA